MSESNLVIIGAGASGLAAAVEAHLAFPKLNITLFEKNPKPAKKILVTGNGRCNFTNAELSAKNFYGDGEFLRNVLTSPFSDSEGFFAECSVQTYTESGRVYPRSQQASAIRDALLARVDNEKIKIITDTPVSSITKDGKKFLVNGVKANAVIIAAGGKASSVQGSDGSAYPILRNFGHSITPLYPALCGLKSSEKFLNQLKGVRALGSIRLMCDNSLLGEEYGEIQFNSDGISGIPVMNLSHLCENKSSLRAELDLCFEKDERELTEHFSLMKNNRFDFETEAVLSGLINNKIAYALMKTAGIEPHTKFGKLSSREISSLVALLKCFEIKIDGTKGFDNAQITQGGAVTDEFNAKTMMSKLCDGFFACGEVLNIHGKCGGYNLHLAWTTGRIAGASASEYIKSRNSK